nr:hypothetical protein OH826_19950 [Streptomyces sp. NBC_00899]
MHDAFGLLAMPTEDDPGIEHDLLIHAGFATEPGDFLYTLAKSPDDPATIRKAVTTLHSSAQALGIRIDIDPAVTAAIEHASGPGAEPGPGGPAAQAGPALTTAMPARSAPAAEPGLHPAR